MHRVVTLCALVGASPAPLRPYTLDCSAPALTQGLCSKGVTRRVLIRGWAVMLLVLALAC